MLWGEYQCHIQASCLQIARTLCTTANEDIDKLFILHQKHQEQELRDFLQIQLAQFGQKAAHWREH